MADKQYLCIDLKSFYASVECVERGLDPMTANLVVADPERTSKTICLAVSPALKARGVSGRARVFEIPESFDYIMAVPRMAKYVEYSARIYGIYLRYFSKDDIHVYSIGLKGIYPDGFSFTCRVSSGTYIRALARDILKQLGQIGTVAELRRTAVDEVKVEDCDTLDDILQGNYRSHDLLELLSSRYETVILDDLSDVKNGKPVKLDCSHEQILISDGKEAVAVYRKQDGLYRCLRGLW